MARLQTEDLSNIKIIRSFQYFFQSSTSAGIILIVTTLIAMIWANSPLHDSYHDLWHTNITISFAGQTISESLHFWINDALMAIFFLLVGLEIKREVLIGELSSFKKALLPILGAIGGVAIPALLYYALNFGTNASHGWAIPTATDIAFSLGVLALLGTRIPLSLKVFLTALAIVDDLAAVLIIALFYGGSINLGFLMIAGIITILLMMLNRLNVMNPLFYLLIGVALWLAMLGSGIHATIAGVLLAFTIPATSKIDKNTFSEKFDKIWSKFKTLNKKNEDSFDNEQSDTIHYLEKLMENVQSPLHRLEHSLHKLVTFAIMPIFALSNAGVYIAHFSLEAFFNPVTLGIILGLFVGKQVGIFAFVWASVKLKITELPEGATMINMYAIAILCGIGFTMSLFVANLTFEPNTDAEIQSKLGILVASALSGIIGYFLLHKFTKHSTANNEKE